MKRKTIKQCFNNFINTLRPMTWSQRMDHLWTYYKLHFLLIIGIPTLIISFAVHYVNSNFDIILSGELVNIFITDEGKEYLDGRLFEHFQGDPEKKQVLYLEETRFEDLDKSKQPDFDYAAIMKVVAKTSAQQLDYLIMNEYGFKTFLTQGILMDLNQFFTPEQLEAFDDAHILVKSQIRDSEVITPIAIEISQFDFSKDCIKNNGRVFFSFCGSTPRMEQCHEFWEYFNNWKDKK